MAESLFLQFAMIRVISQLTCHSSSLRSIRAMANPEGMIGSVAEIWGTAVTGSL